MKIVKLYFLFVITLLLSACMSLTSTHEISGHVGCSPADIKISNRDNSYAIQTFKAVCHKATFYCTATGAVIAARHISCKKSTLHASSRRK